MKTSISKSVGALGQNKTQDIVIIQVMLRLLHRGSNGSGPYYKGAIDGRVGGATTAAIALFAKHYRKQLSDEKGKLQPFIKPLLAPGNILYTELVSGAAGSRFLAGVKNVKNTAILYRETGPRTGKKTFLDKDHLVPSTLSQPLEKLLKGQPFPFELV
jgi:hypothetical protein